MALLLGVEVITVLLSWLPIVTVSCRVTKAWLHRDWQGQSVACVGKSAAAQAVLLPSEEQLWGIDGSQHF